MHPFCRSTTIADFGEDTLKGLERRAKDENGNTIRVPASMTYDEWYAKYVEGIEQPSIEAGKAETAALPGGRQAQIAEHQTAPALIAEHQTAPALIAPTVDGREVVLTESGDFLAFRHVDGLTDEQVSDIINSRRGTKNSENRPNWQRFSLADTIQRLVPGAEPSAPNEKGKIFYTSEESPYQIVYDGVFDYYRIKDTRIPGKRCYVDINGNDANNYYDSDNKQHGRSKSDYQSFTHFDNTDIRK